MYVRFRNLGIHNFLNVHRRTHRTENMWRRSLADVRALLCEHELHALCHGAHKFHGELFRVGLGGCEDRKTSKLLFSPSRVRKSFSTHAHTFSCGFKSGE